MARPWSNIVPTAIINAMPSSPYKAPVALPIINRIRVAGTAEFAGFNDEIHPKRVNYLNSKLNEVYPNIFLKMFL